MRSGAKIVKFIRSIATISILVYGIYYVHSNLDTFLILLDIDWKLLPVMLLFLLLTIFSSASENAMLYQSLGIPIGYVESFRLTNVSAFFNLIFPQGGSITKAVYLKQKYNFPYSKTPAIFLGLFIIYLTVGAGILLITSITTLLFGQNVPYILWILTMAASTSSILLIIDISPKIFMKWGKLGTLIISFLDGWNHLRMNKSFLIKACAWQFVTFICSGVWISTVYHSLGIIIDPLLGISLSVVISFANILVIVPGNLGIQEAVYGYFTILIGISFAKGVVVSTLTRVVILSVTLAMAPVSWYLLFYKQKINLSHQEFNKIKN